MKKQIALLALALSIAAAVPAHADNPTDAPLVSDSGAPETAYPQATQRTERKTSKKERKLKAQQAANQQPKPEAAKQQSAGAMY